MTVTPKLGITNLASRQAGAETTVNEALHTLDSFVHMNILDRDLTAPPGSPVDGAIYLVAGSPTGAWAGQGGKIALYRNGWIFFTPKTGMIAYLTDENLFIRYVPSAWFVMLCVLTANFRTVSITNPTIGDQVTLFLANRNFSIPRISAVLRGSSSPSVTWTLKKASTRNSGSPVEVVTGGTTTTSVSTPHVVVSLSSNTITVGNFFWLEITGVSGTVDEIVVTAEFNDA